QAFAASGCRTRLRSGCRWGSFCLLRGRGRSRSSAAPTTRCWPSWPRSTIPRRARRRRPSACSCASWGRAAQRPSVPMRQSVSCRTCSWTRSSPPPRVATSCRCRARGSPRRSGGGSRPLHSNRAQPAYWRPSVADQPLAGRRIVVTRPEAKPLADALERLGAGGTLGPPIQIRPPEDRRALEDAVARLESYDWVVLTSVNGVSAVGAGLAGLTGRVRIAAVGPVTADAIRSHGIEPAFVATRASEDIAGGLGHLDGSRVLLPQADIADPRLAEELRGQGAEVEVVIAYRTVLVEPPMWGILPLRIADAVVLASGSACRSLAAAGGAGGGALLVCIGPKTAKTAREVGLKVRLVADETTSDGIIQALVTHFGEST